MAQGIVSPRDEWLIREGVMARAHDAPPAVETRTDAGEAAERVLQLDRNTLLANGVFGLERGDIRAQPFMNLRSQVAQRLHSVKGRVLAVTSTQPSSGKSFVAMNLAASLSRICPVYLIDLDLKRPVIGDRLGLPRIDGVETLLRGETTRVDISRRIEGENLTVLTVGTPQIDVSGLLTSPELASLFDDLRSMPDEPICIVDTPPMFEDDDMMLVARHVDGVLLVVEEARTTHREMREALRIMAPTPLLGTVLNRSITPSAISEYYGARYAAA